MERNVIISQLKSLDLKDDTGAKIWTEAFVFSEVTEVLSVSIGWVDNVLTIVCSRITSSAVILVGFVDNSSFLTCKCSQVGHNGYSVYHRGKFKHNIF